MGTGGGWVRAELCRMEPFEQELEDDEGGSYTDKGEEHFRTRLLVSKDRI